MTRVELILKKMDAAKVKERKEYCKEAHTDVHHDVSKKPYFITLGPNERSLLGRDIGTAYDFTHARVENSIVDVEFNKLFKDIVNNALVWRGRNGIIGMSGPLRKKLELDHLVDKKLIFELARGRIYFLGLAEP